MSTIKALSAVFNSSRDADRFCVPPNATDNLIKTCAALLHDENALVGLYVPEQFDPSDAEV
jgi:hypothetical protein